jgi:tripartite-type tricarboxylate transporter receptor subunit TctC
VIVPFAPGGTADILARMIAVKLTDRVGQTVVVENRPGANGNLGTEVVARAPADGYTLLMGYLGSLAINPNLYASVPFDPLKDFAPITNVASTTQAIVSRKDFAASTIPELIRLAQSGKQVNFASAGVGSPSHMAGELFNASAKIKMLHVPYKGSGAVMHDLMGGHVDISFGGLAAAMPAVQAGQLKLLGVTSAKRSPGAPDAPAIAESIPGYEVMSWFGLLAPAGTPKPIVDLLHDEVVAIVNQPEFKDKLATDGAEVIADTPEHFRSFIAEELAKWHKVISDNNLKTE